MVRTPRPHRRPPDEQMDCQEETAGESIQNVDTQSRSSDKEQRRNGCQKRRSVSLPVFLSVSTPGCLWVSALMHALAFSSRKKEREADRGEKCTPACSYDVTLTRSTMENELQKTEKLTVNTSWWFSGCKGDIIRCGTDYRTRKPIWMWRLKVTGVVLTVSHSVYWSFSKLCILMRGFWEKHVNEERYWIMSCTIRNS